MRFEHKKSDFVCVQTSSYRMFTRKTAYKAHLCGRKSCDAFEFVFGSMHAFLVASLQLQIIFSCNHSCNQVGYKNVEKLEKKYWYQATENNVYSHAQGVTVSKRIQILLLFFPIAIPQFHIINKLYSIYCMQFNYLFWGYLIL